MEINIRSLYYDIININERVIFNTNLLNTFTNKEIVKNTIKKIYLFKSG